MREIDTHNPRAETYISKKYLIISIGLSVLAMALVVYFTYTPGVLEKLKPKRLPGLGIALIVSFLRLWFAASRIRFLSGKKISILGSLRTMLAWDFTSAVTPSTVGGAPFATFAMTKEGIKLGESSAIVLYGVLLDQIWFATAVPLLLLSGIYYDVVPSEIGAFGEYSMLLLYLLLLAYAGVLAYGVLFNPLAIKKIIQRVFRLPFLKKWSAKISKESDNLVEYAHEMRKKPFSFIVKAYFLTVMSWICRISLPTIVVLSLLPANEILSFLRSLAMNLAFMFIPTPGGSGGVEGLFYLFQGPLITDAAFIGLAVFAWRIISYYVSIGFGMMATTWYINSSIKE